MGKETHRTTGRPQHGVAGQGRHDDDGHGHGHAHAYAVGDDRRLGFVAAITGLFMLAEVAGGLVSGSLALIADAGHMLTDFASLVLA